MLELTPNRQVWLIEVVGKAPVEDLVGAGNLPPNAAEDGKSVVDQQEQWEKKAKAKEKRLEKIRSELADSRDQIHQLMDMEVTIVENGKEKTIPFFKKSVEWDPNSEFDEGRHMKMLKDDFDPRKRNMLQAGMDKVNKLRDTLTGTIQPRDFALIYKEHTEEHKSLAEIAEERMVSEETIRKVIERQAMILATSVDETARKAILENARANKSVEEIAGKYAKDKGVIEQVLQEERLKEAGIPTNLQKEIADQYKKAFDEKKAELQEEKNPTQATAEFAKKQCKELFEEFKKKNSKLTLKDVENIAAKGPSTSDILGKPIVDDEPLFSDLELRQEYFDPLVRERIIPDNQVEDRYNQTVQQFKGGSDAYNERLQKYSAGLGENDEKIQACKQVGMVVKSLTTVAGDITTAVGDLAKTGSDLAEQTELAGKVIDLIQSAGALTCATVEGVYAKKAEGAIDAVGDVIASGLKAFGIDSTLADQIKAGYVGAVKATEFGIAICSPDKQKWDCTTLIGEAIENSFVASGDEDWARAGKAIGWAFKQAVNAKAVYDAMHKNPPAIDTAIKLIAGAAAAAVKAGLTDPNLENEVEDVKRAKEEDYTESQIQDEKDTYEAEIDEVFEGFAGEDEESGSEEESSEKEKSEKETEKKKEKKEGSLADRLKKAFADPKTAEKARKKMEQAAMKELKKEIKAELKADELPKNLTEARLNLSSDAMDESMVQLRKEFDSVDKLIADIEKRRMYVKMAQAIFDAGVGAAAQFLPALKMATAGKDLVKNLMITYVKTKEVAQWRQNRHDALVAASVQGFTFQNRIDNLDFQITQAEAKAVLALAQFIGAAIATSGVLYAAGQAVEKSASAASALLDLALQFAKESDLKKAWEAYQEALKHPNDRTGMRKAITMNATLAKYAMVYAALKENDPIAKLGMTQAGLTEEVLRNPGSNVQNVVKYLETTWEDDPLVLRRVPLKDWQADQSGALTLTVFLSNKAAAMDPAKMVENVLKPGGTGGIEGALQGLEQARKDATAAESEADKTEKAIGGDTDKVIKAMGEFTVSQEMCKDAKPDFEKIQTLYNDLTSDFRSTKIDGRPLLAKEWLDKLRPAAIQLDQLRVPIDTLLANAKECEILGEFVKKTDPYIKALADVPAKLDVIETALTAVRQQLGVYKPLKKSDNKVNDTFQQYTTGLQKEAEEQLKELAERRNKIGADQIEFPKLRDQAAKFSSELKGLTDPFATLKIDVDKLDPELKEHIKACEQEQTKLAKQDK